MAYYLLNLYVRADDIGLVTEGRVRFPFTQQHLADAIGLSLVHTNKTLKRLGRSGQIQWEHGWFSARVSPPWPRSRASISGATETPAA